MYSLIPFWFVGGLLALGALFGLAALIWSDKRTWLRQWLIRSCWIYALLFSAVIEITTNIELDFTLQATWRLTPGTQPGTDELVTLDYVNYPGRYERVNVPEIHQYLGFKSSPLVTVMVRVSYDFGKVRGYGLEKVDQLPANVAWVSGNPPWDLLRQLSLARRWLIFIPSGRAP